MYIGSDCPQRLLNITPAQPPSDQPSLDLLTEYVTRVLDTALRGLLIEEEGDWEFSPSASTHEQACACGATAPGIEHYIRLDKSGPRDHVLPSLALHYMIWHRNEIPKHHLRQIKLAVTSSLRDKISNSHLEPPVLVEKRAATQRTEAIMIIREALLALKQKGKPNRLTVTLEVARVGVGTQEIGWTRTNPLPNAIAAIYLQIFPNSNANHATEYLGDQLSEWAHRPNRTLLEVEQVLENAITQLIANC